MAAQRLQVYNQGAWRVGTKSELASVEASFGTDAYVVDEAQWYKYNGTAWVPLFNGVGAVSTDITWF